MRLTAWKFLIGTVTCPWPYNNEIALGGRARSRRGGELALQALKKRTPSPQKYTLFFQKKFLDPALHEGIQFLHGNNNRHKITKVIFI